MRIILLLIAAAISVRAQPEPPPQVKSGPGSSGYPHAAVKTTKHGKGGTEFHLFQPADPAPEVVPVIVFLHGWTAIDPWLYGAWIEHLVKRGNIVIYPRWQENFMTPQPEFTPNAVKAVLDAKAELEKQGHVLPDWQKFAIAGHSVGGLLTASLGALAAEKGLPAPKALMSVQPGRSARGQSWGVPLADLSRIPAETLLLCITGERDNVCGAGDALRIYEESAAIPGSRKSVIEQPLEVRGGIKLTGSHLAPCSVPADPLDALVAEGELRDPPAAALISAAGGDFREAREFLCTPVGRQWRRVKLREVAVGETFDFPNAQDFALWRLFDTLCAAAFAGKADDHALARTPEALSMGLWSDGATARPMRLLK